jgi:hypothetical protein
MAETLSGINIAMKSEGLLPKIPRCAYFVNNAGIYFINNNHNFPELNDCTPHESLRIC